MTSPDDATPAPDTSSPAAWCDDPSGRHMLRYWNGTRWTEHVADREGQGTDPPRYGLTQPDLDLLRTRIPPKEIPDIDMSSALTAHLARDEQIRVSVRAFFRIMPLRVHGVREFFRNWRTPKGRWAYAALTDRRLIVTGTKPAAEPILSAPFDTIFNVDTVRSDQPEPDSLVISLEIADDRVVLEFSEPLVGGLVQRTMSAPGLDRGEHLGRALASVAPRTRPRSVWM